VESEDSTIRELQLCELFDFANNLTRKHQQCAIVSDVQLYIMMFKITSVAEHAAYMLGTIVEERGEYE